MLYSWIMLWCSPYSRNYIFLPGNRLYSMKCMLGIRVSHCEKIMFMWLQWILVSLPWKDCVHLNYVNFEGSFSWDVHVTSVCNDESYHVKSIFMCTLWAMVSLTAPKSIFMWTLWAKVNVTERSTYWCELCELWWVLPSGVHIHVNSVSYGESYRKKSIFMWTLLVMVNLTVMNSIFHGT